MKVFVSALVVLSLLVGGMVGNTLYVQKTLNGFRRDLNAIPHPTDDATDLSLQHHALIIWKDAWMRAMPFLGISLNHQDLMEAEGQLAALIGAAEANSPDNYLSSHAQLDYVLRHLSQMAGFSVQTFLSYTNIPS